MVLNEYAQSQKTRSEHTIKSYNAALTLYLGFLETIKGMSKEAVKALLKTPDLSTKTGRRDLAFLVLMYGTATRIDELLSLKVNQLQLAVKKPFVNILGKNNKIRTLYLLPKAAAHIKQYLHEFHGDSPRPNDYIFYSRNGGGKMSQTAINKRIKKYAVAAHSFCKDVPLTLHAHQIRHAKASHWLEDGMNIVQISFLLGHEQLDTTMVYLDITTEQEAKALATLEDENDKLITKKWKSDNGGLSNFCGVKPMHKQIV
jgi:site-specific recombinase XerD